MDARQASIGMFSVDVDGEGWVWSANEGLIAASVEIFGFVKFHQRLLKP